MAEAKTAVMPMPRGYPSDIADVILKRLAEGESLSAICRDKNMPGRQTVMDWLRDPRHVAFQQAYIVARHAAAHHYADQVIELASKEYDTSLEVNAARLKVDSLKWACGRLHPQAYSDRYQVEHTGKDGAELVPTDTREIGKAILAVLGSARVSAAVQIEPPESDHTAIPNGKTR